MSNIEDLRTAIGNLHGCEVGNHLGSFPIKETFQGIPVWEGIVEVFELINHPKSKRCYAWSHASGPNDIERRYVAVLELSPVDTPLKAVQAAIVDEFKNRR